MPALTLYIWYITGVIFLALLAWVVYLHMKLRKFMRGQNGASLEDAITSSRQEIEELRAFEKECLDYFTDLEVRVGRSLQTAETVRFNPFHGTGDGGNQSFATALISERGDGVVVSSIYARDRVGVFGKPLAKFESTYELTDEERAVIEAAKAKLKSSSTRT